MERIYWQEPVNYKFLFIFWSFYVWIYFSYLLDKWIFIVQHDLLEYYVFSSVDLLCSGHFFSVLEL